MAPGTRIECRSLSTCRDRAEALAAAAGAHGVYVRNALAAGAGEGGVFLADSQELGLAWVGERGNLILIAAADRFGDAADAVLDPLDSLALPWRIAMGPAVLIDRLRQRCGQKPLVHRDQVYYQGGAVDAVPALVSSELRPADRSDLAALAKATLLLNESDLNIAPRRVDRRWLYESIEERLRDRKTWVLGPSGQPRCKLDIGSDGPGGAIVEGVFTFPEHRGQGLATRLVASVLAAARGPVYLHVGAHNAPARRAYARAGMSPVAGCRLLLLG